MELLVNLVAYWFTPFFRYCTTTSSKDTSSKDTSSKDTSSKDTSSKDTSSKDTSSKDTPIVAYWFLPFFRFRV